ncbi:MAG: GNAT family N-acetyltransferase [Planctomycetaceae bacterium]|nr:GNAT family N-acetyltransferase [Planctomycetaceae bacterium]
MATTEIQTKTTYLQMLHRPEGQLANPPESVRIHEILAPSVSFYQALYRCVGSQLHWYDRLVMPASELRRLLADPGVNLFTLQVEGVTAGYCELDCRNPDEIELAYFGLFPQFLGRGLGKFFLRWTVRESWTHRPQRVWLHTCDLDHPAALPNYIKAGFQVYDETWVNQTILDDRTNIVSKAAFANPGPTTLKYPQPESQPAQRR